MALLPHLDGFNKGAVEGDIILDRDAQNHLLAYRHNTVKRASMHRHQIDHTHTVGDLRQLCRTMSHDLG